MSTERRLTFLRWLSLLTVIGLSVFVFSLREQVETFALYGYPGIFLIALLSNATVLLPAPGLAVVFTMGSILHPFSVALAASTGGAIGELSGYMAGFSGQVIIERMDVYERIIPWVKKYGTLAILVFAAVPNPFFDLAGIAAGVTKIPIKNFLLACWVGQLIKTSVFAYAGSTSFAWLFS